MKVLAEFWILRSGFKARTSAVPFWGLKAAERDAADRKTNLQDSRRVFIRWCFLLQANRFIFVGISWFLFESLPNVAFPHARRAASIKGEIKTKKSRVSDCFYVHFATFLLFILNYSGIKVSEGSAPHAFHP